MASDGAHLSDYDPRVVSKLRGEAVRILRAFGFASGHVVIVGGLVPSLLVPRPEPGLEPHIGTTDLDVCLSVALVDGDVGAYERLESSLKQAGFQMAREPSGATVSWRWVGGVRVPVTLEFFCPAAEGRPPGRFHRPGGVVGGKLSAMTLAMGRLIDEDVREVRIEVDLPEGGRTQHALKVAGPAAYLAAKVDALQRRTKNKDAYDLIWLIECWPGGQAGLAEELKASPIADRQEFRAALEALAFEFAGIDAAGALKYARFMKDDDSSLDRLARRAVGAVRELLERLKT